MASKVHITLEVDDKGSAKIKGFGGNADAAFKKIKAGAIAGSNQAGKMERAWHSSIKNIERHWKSYAAAAGVAMAATAAVIVAGSKKALAAASDLQEVQGKFDVVFEGQQAKAEGWSKTLVDAYAMSTRESKQYLSSVQDLLVPMGMSADKAGLMSNEVVKLSADLGSFNNLPTGKVMEDIQSALVGNYETMKKYGVVLNASVVQEKALAMGLAGTKDELTAGMKAQASYQLMVEGSTAAIGDMARTQESAANQEKQTKALLEDITALFGKALIPYYQAALKEINNWLKANKDVIAQNLPGYIEKVGDAIIFTVKVMRFFHNGWQGVKLVGTAAMHAIAVSLDELLGGLRFLLKPLDLIFAGLKKIGAIDVNPFDCLAESLGEFRASSADVTKDVLKDIAQTNKTYDLVIGKVEGWQKQIKAIPVEQIKTEKQVTKSIKQIGKVQTTMSKAAAKEAAKTEKARIKAVKDYAKESTKIYDRMYDDVQKLDLGDYKYSEKLLDKRYKNYKEHLVSLEKQDKKYAGGVKLLDKWLAGEKEKLWDKQAKEHGGLIDTMKVAWKDFSKDSLKTSKTMYDAWKNSMGLMKTAMSDTFYAAFTGNIKDIGSIWSTFTKNLKSTFMRMVSDIAAQKIILLFKNAWDGNPAGKGTIEKMLGIDVPFLSFASGGAIPGAYNGKKGFAGDTVPIMATPGEYMVRREAAQDPAIRSLLDSLNQGGTGAGLIARGKNIPAMMGYAEGGIIAPELSHYGFGSFFSSVWSGVKSAVSSVVSVVGDVIGVVSDIPIVGDVLKTVFKVVGELTSFLSETDLGRTLALIGNVALAVATGGASIPAQLAGFGIGAGLSLATGSDWKQAAWNASTSAMFAGGASTAAAAMDKTTKVQLASGRWVDVPAGSITDLGAGSYYQTPTGEFLPIAAVPENNLATYWSIASQAPKDTIANIQKQAGTSWAKMGDFAKSPWEELQKTGADLGELTKEKWEALQKLPADAWAGIKDIPGNAWDFMRNFNLPTYLAGNMPGILGNMQLSVASASGGESLGRMSETLGIARRGGLLTRPTIAGEYGDEWAVPTYEPERSQFLKDVGADPDKLAASIANKLGGGSGGHTIHIDNLVNVEGTLIADEDTFNDFVEKIDQRLYKLQQWGH